MENYQNQECQCRQCGEKFSTQSELKEHEQECSEKDQQNY